MRGVPGFSILFALIFLSVVRSEAETLKPDCTSLEAYSQTHGVMISVAWSHAAYPTAIQSQSCAPDNQITAKQLKTFMVNMVVASGCGPETAAYEGTVKQFEESVLDKQITSQDITKIPKRYISDYPNLCTSEDIKSFKRCVVSSKFCLTGSGK